LILRILDIGVATSYALVCLALVSVMNPYSAGVQVASNTSNARASEAIFEYIQSVGLVFLANASPSELCASLQQHSNSTLELGGNISGFACLGAPSTAEGKFTLVVSLSGRRDVIEAWIEKP
jgi:hypothetical protein